MPVRDHITQDAVWFIPLLLKVVMCVSQSSCYGILYASYSHSPLIPQHLQRDAWSSEMWEKAFFMGKDHSGIDIWQTFGYSGNIRFWEETLRTHETSLFPC